MLVYAVTIFLSAFLLFQVQPMIAKFILPWFGGSAAVWSAALLFFQLLLLAGYLYAHCVIRYLKPKQQLITHGALLVISLATLPILPAARWKPGEGGDPTLNILVLLGATIGLPYTLLSSTSPLLQAWYLRTHAGSIPYRLFALSNFGSFLALLSYPFLVEPRIALSNQAYAWSAGFALFAAICLLAGWKSRAGEDPVRSQAPVADAQPPSAATMLLWVGLAACASTLLLATTSHLTQNVAPIPLLWVAPLSLYLLSFILCFESDRIYQRWLFLPFVITAFGLFTYGMNQYENNADVIKRLIPALCVALFIVCMVCHGELARRKPHPRHLTLFFLMVSVGGALGGLFVALIAPRVFNNYMEMPVGVVACGFLVTCALWNGDKGVPRPWYLRAAMLAAVAGLAVYLGYIERKENSQYYLAVRNFYGVLRIRDDLPDEATPGVRVLIHGTINHGTELKGPGSGRIPTSYFGDGSGISRAIRTKGAHGPIHIGILGLGAGVTASLARPGDTVHYYEINPLIEKLANTEFSFFPSCPADKKLFLGDGRLVLERLPGEQLDFLAMDAFSSDSVPMHLLTSEAYQIYLKHLKPDGFLAVNVSNRYLDLEPVVSQAAAEIGWTGVVVTDDGAMQPFYVSSTWIILAKSASAFEAPLFVDGPVQPLRTHPGFRAWTDDYSNILKILKTD